jgi:hypothetical protein
MTEGPRPAAPAAPTAPTAATGPRQLLATLRPQRFGRASPWKIADPVVEPEWIGIRSLAAIDLDGALIVDAAGDEIDEMTTVIDALAAAARSDGLILDGFLTKQVAMARSAKASSDEMPSMSSMFIGHRSAQTDATAHKEAAVEARTFAPDDDICFVATDLLWLDDTPLFDIPLLERRRLLEAVVVESDVVRVGAFVRPPLDRWINSWRGQGFTGLTFKAPNSRYTPGAENKDWALGGMPRR